MWPPLATESYVWHKEHIDLKMVVKEGSLSNAVVRHVSGVGTMGDI